MVSLIVVRFSISSHEPCDWLWSDAFTVPDHACAPRAGSAQLAAQPAQAAFARASHPPPRSGQRRKDDATQAARLGGAEQRGADAGVFGYHANNSLPLPLTILVRIYTGTPSTLGT